MNKETRRKVKKFWRDRVFLTVGVIGSLCILPFAAVESFQTYKQEATPQRILDVQPKLKLLFETLEQPDKSIVARKKTIKEIEKIAQENKLGFTRILASNIYHSLILEKILSSKEQLSQDELEKLLISLDILLSHSFRYSFYHNYLSEDSSWIISSLLSYDNLERDSERSLVKYLEQALVQDFKKSLVQDFKQYSKSILIQKSLEKNPNRFLLSFFSTEEFGQLLINNIAQFEKNFEQSLKKTFEQEYLRQEDFELVLEECFELVLEEYFELVSVEYLENEFLHQAIKIFSLDSLLSFDVVVYIKQHLKKTLLDKYVRQYLLQASERSLKKVLEPDFVKYLEKSFQQNLVQDLVRDLKLDLELDLELDLVRELERNHEWDFNRGLVENFESDFEKDLVGYLELDFEEDFLKQIIEIKQKLLKLRHNQSVEKPIEQLMQEKFEKFNKIYELELSQSYGLQAEHESLSTSQKQAKLIRFILLASISAIGLMASSLLLIRQRNQGITWNMTGYCFLPQECFAELETKFEKLKSEGKSDQEIFRIMLPEIRDIIISVYIRVVIEDLFSPGKNKRD